MKKLFILLTTIIVVTLSACQKQSELINPGRDTNTQSQANRVNILQSPNTIYLTAKINTNQVYSPMTVKVIHWDYQNGHTPMVITGRDSFQIQSNSNSYIQHLRNTGFSYTGKMQVDIYSDSLNRLDYTRTVMLTDSLGWTINWDTTGSNQPGWVGVNRIVDVLPKHY